MQLKSFTLVTKKCCSHIHVFYELPNKHTLAYKKNPLLSAYSTPLQGTKAHDPFPSQPLISPLLALQATMAPRLLACNLCDQTFETQVSLQQHQKDAHLEALVNSRRMRVFLVLLQ
jgi:hypothetical protein